MAHEIIPIDITNAPELRRLAEEVAKTRTPRVLRRDDEDIAVLSPAPARKRRSRRARTAADLEAFRSSAGGWKGIVDVDKFLNDIDESRRLSRPPVEL